MICTDKYLDAKYDKKKYNCFHFASDIWRELTGENTIVGSPADMKKHFERTPVPISPCLAVFTGKNETHIGVYIEGKILHLTKEGAVRERLASVKAHFSKVSFYKRRA